MFTVYLFTFAKNENSTGQPVLTAGSSFSCQLKENCSIIRPQIILDIGIASSPSNYNYAYIPDFGRYYHILEWTFEGPLVVASMLVDVLATYKTAIGSTSLYVLRAQNASNGYIVDNFYPTTVQKTITNVAPTWLTNPFVSDLTSGYYVCGVINQSSDAMGAVAYYVFSNTQFRTLMHALLHETTWLGTITDVSEDFLKALYNPFEYIVSCMWFPFAPPLGSAVSDLPYGWWTLSGVSCRKLGSSAVTLFSLSFTLPSHPQISRGQYLNAEPFRQMVLHLPFLGDTPVNASSFIGATRLEVYGRVDCITGDCIVQIGNGASLSSSDRLQLYTGNLGVQIQISQVAVDRLGQTETVIGSVANIGRDASEMLASTANNVDTGVSGAARTLGQAFGVLGTVTHSIADGTRAQLPKMYTRGANGSVVWTGTDITLTVEFLPIVDEDLAHAGRPLCALRTPSTLGGYMQIRTGDVPISGTAEEAVMIRNYLESGFYYE